MSSLLRVDNFQASNTKHQTSLTSDVAAGVSVLPVGNGSDFVAGDILFIGSTGYEQVERKVVQSVTDYAITLTAPLEFGHKGTDPVRAVYGDHISIYRVAVPGDNSVPADAAFGTAIATFFVNLAQPYTDYQDTTGGPGYWYKTTFTDTNLFESPLSDSIATRGGAYGQYATIEDVKNEAGMQGNVWIDNTEVLKRIKAAQDVVNGMLRGAYNIPFTYVPDSINQITRLLAAGHLLNNEYGVMAKLSTKDGSEKIKEAEEMLLDIKEGYVVLLDQSGNSMRLNTAISSYPNNGSALIDPIRDQSQDGVHMATMDDIY